MFGIWNGQHGKGQRMVEQLLLPDRDLTTNPRRFETPHSCKKYNSDHVQSILTRQNGSKITKTQFDAYVTEMANKQPEYINCGPLGKSFGNRGQTF